MLSLALGLLGAAPSEAIELEVRVEGLQGELEANVLAFLSIHNERAETDLTAARIEALHRRAPDQIRTALAPFGFYRVKIEDRLEPPAAASGTWRAYYRIEPGEPVRIARVDYRITGEGATDPVFPKTFPMKVGDVLLHAVYEQAKSDLRHAATSAGYLDYRLDRHQVLIDLQAYEAQVFFYLETGPQYRLGAVRFKQDLLDEGLLRRYVHFKPGEVYNPDVLLGLQGRLLSSEYYSDIEIIPLKDEVDADNRVPIEVVAQRNKANEYRIGLGFATDVGPRLTLDYRRRYLTSQGDKLRTELNLSPALSQWDLDYRLPIQDPTRDYILVKPVVAYYDKAIFQGWAHSLQVAHSTLSPGGWRRNLGLDYSYEDLSLNEAPLEATSELALSVSWSKTVADDPILTNDGYRITYSLVGSVQGLISEASYLSGQVRFKWVRRFAPNYRLLTRADLGATWAERVTDLPAGRRFYAGGDSSIRGWGFDALGPNDPKTDDTLGGRYLAVGSLELERRLQGRWSAAVFTDFGNAFDPDYSQELAQSVGLGLRWASPIGQVRFDLAFAVSKDADAGIPPARLHIVIGPDL
ncbi:autotransporter assembly complex protein TamA [Thermochromatium tepidum]|nr:autotransporter assembly complex family protein [Thermochromatium tepidum]